MGITFTRKVGSNRPGFVIVKKRKTEEPVDAPVDKNLTPMRFDGPLLDRSIQFPEDVAQMKGWLRSRGLAVGEKDCQALWTKLSEEFYPFGPPGPRGAWLTMGYVYDIFREHAREFLVPCDARDAVR